MLLEVIVEAKLLALVSSSSLRNSLLKTKPWPSLHVFDPGVTGDENFLASNYGKLLFFTLGFEFPANIFIYIFLELQ
jgi:hypothetical protein